MIYYVSLKYPPCPQPFRNPNSLSHPLPHFYFSSTAPIPHLSNSISLRLNNPCLHLTSPLHLSVSHSHRSKTHNLKDTLHSLSHCFILFFSLSIVCDLWHRQPSPSHWLQWPATSVTFLFIDSDILSLPSRRVSPRRPSSLQQPATMEPWRERWWIWDGKRLRRTNGGFSVLLLFLKKKFNFKLWFVCFSSFLFELAVDS